MEFSLLGAVEARHAGAAVDLGGRRQRALLAALLLRANSFAGVGYLAESVWETPPAAPESNIRTYVAGLRRRFRAVGADETRLATRPGGYLLTVEPGELDVVEFRDLAAEGERALREGDFASAMAELGRALDLWRGEPLDGLGYRGAPLAAETSRLSDLRLAVAEHHARAAIGLGRADLVVGPLRSLLAEHPFREELWAQAILALHQCGRQAEALDAFATARRRLVDELGVEPGPRLRRLHQRVLAGTAAADAEPDEFSAHRQLPMDVAEFTGRAAELRLLRAPAPDTTAVYSIEGMAGVGKTRLAVHAAHRLADVYDDVQLWVDLRGFDHDQEPVDPAVALEGFLRALGVPGHRIPAEPQDRAALYRHRLAGRRALVLLDNAASADQVRPLLPGTPGSLVLITSRRGLTDLDGADTVLLDVLAPDEAVGLIGRVAGARRVADDPAAAARIAELCGHLPIAVTLAARRLQVRPMWTARNLADRLESADQRLARLSSGSRDLHSVFDLSYRALSPEQRRVFRLVGLHPGDDFAADSAAALADLPLDRVDVLLESLVDAHLLQQATIGRYHFHDLVRPYARYRAHADESGEQRRDAVSRLLTWYLHAADSARRTLAPHHRRSFEIGRFRARCPVPEFPGYQRALDWCEAECANLEAVVRAAADLRADVAWRLPSVLVTFYYLRSHWTSWLATHDVALAAARGTGERHGEAIILRGLSVAYSDLHRFDEAIACHHAAQAIFRQVGDRHGQAWNLNNLGVVHVDLDRLADAARCLTEALPLFQEIGDRHGEGICLNNLGDTYRRLGQPTRAIDYLERALSSQHRTGDQAGLRFTLTSLGDIHRDTGAHDLAIQRYSEALATARALGDQRMIGRTLVSLGHVLTEAGRPDAAATHWRDALAIFEELGDPQAEATRTLLS
ncbi:AfsR/SARP family transcriptional regulator [Actinokineospora iranica]|uniref:DNA-binding transcriptional activator of the SARP family n=1 Tax=Actinokineospora iranica TaxID=1271860 RepID=A0A1G6S3N0_9PSEU|nr:tetratricopeptide repeat protein [Actinokineospora iranica]SDD11293.1 DNA-binding transcriptional activator of the SARP family [Actinokineospora iranica]